MTKDHEDDGGHEWPHPADKAYAVDQARRLHDRARKGGLKFEVYLPPSLALWLLDRIEQGHFLDPSEATFVLLGEAQDTELHVDLRNELLKCSMQSAINDPRPGISGEDMFERMREKSKSPLPEPAQWKKQSRR
ncbi:hypothetical protein HNR26_004911 [Rhizobium rosettiformans]|uniref:CopG family transcriptional regulator n=2 Tax=Rhizobium rosettiformans TaxID=1368430 RepID=A0A4S8PKM6_9HYPH|nr:hypothetical protein [Rhizobium rosettiformans]MBB5278797.1 hypothetical protein [Rhizobium rosettiformans]THV28794.1 hypothetical protein FAA86_23895 [Rhizobium rosettiformans W3]